MILEEYSNLLLLDLYSFVSEKNFLQFEAWLELKCLINLFLKTLPAEYNMKILSKVDFLKTTPEHQQMFYIFLMKVEHLLNNEKKNQKEISNFLKNLNSFRDNLFGNSSKNNFKRVSTVSSPKKHSHPSTINKFPNEILNLIFSNIKTDNHSSNELLLNLALVKRQWSSVALPLIYSKLYTNHDDLIVLHKLVKGLTLNRKYAKNNTCWFKPNITHLEFFSRFKNTCKQYKVFNRELILNIVKFSKNLKLLAFIVNERERVEFDLYDLSYVFETCPKLISLDLNSIHINYQEDEETLRITREGFSKLTTFRVLGFSERELMFVFGFFKNNLRYLELEEVTPRLAFILQGKLDNLISLNLTRSNAPFHSIAANTLFKHCPRLKSFYTFRLSNVIFDALINNNIKLSKLQGWLDGRGDDDLFFVDFDTVSRFFRSNKSNLTEINFGLIKFNLFSGKNNLRLLSENLVNLKQLSIFANYNQNINSECLFKSVSSSDFKSFLSDFKNFLANVRKLKLFLFKFEDEIEGNEEELKEIKKLLNEFKIKYE
ncbi:hypothetical protein HDU92_000560 [Lobulomyces angularis]|nr:hypothetical protein HDU92_000560 [Lobulomyces angularis]